MPDLKMSAKTLDRLTQLLHRMKELHETRDQLHTISTAALSAAVQLPGASHMFVAEYTEQHMLALNGMLMLVEVMFEDAQVADYISSTPKKSPGQIISEAQSEAADEFLDKLFTKLQDLAQQQGKDDTDLSGTAGQNHRFN